MDYGRAVWDLGQQYKARDAGMRVPMAQLLRGRPPSYDAPAQPRRAPPNEEQPSSMQRAAALTALPMVAAGAGIKSVVEPLIESVGSAARGITDLVGLTGRMVQGETVPFTEAVDTAARGAWGLTEAGIAATAPAGSLAAGAARRSAKNAVGAAADDAALPDMSGTLARLQQQYGSRTDLSPIALQVAPERQQAIQAFTSAPAIQSGGDDALVRRILEHAAARGDKPWPKAQSPVFKTTPEAYASTTELVPQSREFWENIPRPARGEKLPEQGRAQQIIEATPQIAQWFEQTLGPSIRGGAETGKFYHTGPVIQGLQQHAQMNPREAVDFMREWSGYGAATSPRTATPPNLRNASYLMWRDAQGIPFTREQFDQSGNLPGMRMMGFHVDLADKFKRGEVDMWANPKPGTFRENWAGNLEGVTADTHGIRDTLIAFDSLYPGQLHPRWFSNDEAYRAYKDQGKLPHKLDVGNIRDSLGGVARKGRQAQTEYGVMAEPMMQAGERMGVPGSTVQAQGWFDLGERTGLASPPTTIPQLLNDQIEETARATGLHPETILRLWGRRRIPLG